MKSTVFILVAFIFAFSNSLSAQEMSLRLDKSQACDPENIIENPETLPEYVTGKNSLVHELADRIKLERKMSGKMVIQFIVNCQGRAVGHLVLKGLNPTSDKEVVRELQKMQRWKAGTMNGEPVDAIYNIGFEIEKGKILEEE